MKSCIEDEVLEDLHREGRGDNHVHFFSIAKITLSVNNELRLWIKRPWRIPSTMLIVGLSIDAHTRYMIE